MMRFIFHYNINPTKWTIPSLSIGQVHLSFKGCLVYFFVLNLFFEFLSANSVDPDQVPRSTASDLGLHCLPKFQKWIKKLTALPRIYLDKIAVIMSFCWFCHAAGQMWFYQTVMHSKDVEETANGVDPDQTDPSGAV